MQFLRRIALTLSAAFCLAGPAAAQQHEPTPQPVIAVPVPVRDEVRPALWKVADADTTIYLFGTVHLLPGGIDWFGKTLTSAVDQADELITEIPESPDGAAMQAVMKYGILPPGKSLRSLLTRREKGIYAKAMASQGLSVAAFDRYRLWYAAVRLGTLPLQRSGYDLSHGVEATLAARSKAQGHPRRGLETIDFQLGLLAGLPLAVQKRYLFEVIKAIPTIDEDVGAMITAWSKGDAQGLAKLLNEEESDPLMLKTLLTDRNITWARWVKARLDQPGKVFVAVGAGHLGGTGSVQDQLTAAGVSVTRVQ